MQERESSGLGNSQSEFRSPAEEQRLLNLDLATQVVHRLRRDNLFITTVESCTGGGLANAITNISGASEVIKGAFVTYSNEQKVALGVPPEIIDEHGVYSLQTAEAMARIGLQRAVSADVAVGITGSISRADPNNPNSVPGVIYVATVFGDKVDAQVFNFMEGERWEIKDKAVGEALKMVLGIIEANDENPQSP
ncbi:MAG: CinA family protein [Candidatus Levyibacteriota bacterium]